MMSHRERKWDSAQAYLSLPLCRGFDPSDISLDGRSCRNQTHASGVGSRCAVITPNSRTGTALAIRTPSHRVTAGVLIAIEHRQHGPERACRSHLAAL